MDSVIRSVGSFILGLVDRKPLGLGRRTREQFKDSHLSSLSRQGRLGFLVPALCFILSTSFVTSQEADSPAESQIVVETNLGTMVFEVFPNAAPAHVELFLKRIREDYYVGTTFHRAISMGIIQGGDPKSKQPENWDAYGTGGLMELDDEFNAISHLRGTLSAVRIPGRANSAGAQFFVCVTDQIQLDGQFTAFGRVAEGIEVAEKISQLPSQEDRLLDRVEILRTYERTRPAPEPVPYAEATVEELSRLRVRIRTELGDFEIGFFAQEAPEHVRQFLRFAELGLYNGTDFHRVVPGFVIQGGSLQTRNNPIPEKQLSLIKNLQPEFNQHLHELGTVAMARAEALDSAVDSFYITLTEQPSLDHEYTVFGKVVRGLDTIDGISQVPVRGETPIFPVEVLEMEIFEGEPLEGQ